MINAGTYATAATLAGWAVGGLCFGIVGDRWGRSRTLATSVLVYSLFTGLCGLATSALNFCLYRFLMGAGIGGAFATAAALIAETMPPHARSFSLGMFSALSLFGNATGAVLARFLFIPEKHYFIGSVAEHGVSGWRLLFFVGAVPAFLVVGIIRNIKESEQWQAARQVAASDINRQMGDVRSMFTQARWRRSTLVAVGLATAAIVGVWGVGFWTPELLKNALPLSGDAIAKIKAESLLLQDAGGFAGILLFTTMANLIGRRPVFAVAFVGSFAIIAYLFLTLNAAWQVYVLCPILGFFTISIMGGLVFYLPELFPTRLRSTGIAFGYNAARMSAAIVMLLGNTIREAFANAGFKHPFQAGMVALASIYLLGLLVLIWAPETRGKPLPED